MDAVTEARRTAYRRRLGYEPERGAALLADRRAGATQKALAQQAGVSLDRMRMWITFAESDEREKLRGFVLTRIYVRA